MTSRNERRASPPAELRYARPFLAHHLRTIGDQRLRENGTAIHSLARWVENLPARHHEMRRLEAADCLLYNNGKVAMSSQSNSLLVSISDSDASIDARDHWLTRLVDTIVGSVSTYP